ncbi:MAG: hypothetical protein CVT89_03700 [Candidatus Altiarchaeales archaeon HGW-Altiarchaeales-2]|nr:MAG: hypothetical protein CVT89_03700 [Candidatus Altiarchaeales archaeon HGW-Altiarchaeales-2]
MKTCKSCMIYIEDRCGVKFIADLINRIRRELGINVTSEDRIKIQSTQGAGGITGKIEELIKTGKIRHECVIIIFDNDRGKKIGKNINIDKKSYVKKTIKEKGIGRNVFLIVFENAIEKDWIEKGMKQLPDNYEKYKLPEYAYKIDLNFLKEQDENFRNFITIIDP